MESCLGGREAGLQTKENSKMCTSFGENTKFTNKRESLIFLKYILHIIYSTKL